MKKFIIAAGMALALLVPSVASASSTNLCYSSGKTRLVAMHVSCSTAITMLGKAGRHLSAHGTRTFTVSGAGHSWYCTVKLHKSTGDIACVYDSSHGFGARVPY